MVRIFPALHAIRLLQTQCGQALHVPRQADETPSAGHLAQAAQQSLRNALEKTTRVVGANGTYTMSPEDHGGYDPKPAVLIEVAGGKWKLVK